MGNGWKVYRSRTDRASRVRYNGHGDWFTQHRKSDRSRASFLDVGHYWKLGLSFTTKPYQDLFFGVDREDRGGINAERNQLNCIVADDE
ncbi:predicted protein [Botrytis cinerea T4]|uniref:Uncharacterized protein n=1 Tax=Botryotinia fuckeliana (strain T4) TaxID=999810 RepID=G2Y4W4_BOTF4|nr:predicted protein [Botrytis cinerea T4]